MPKGFALLGALVAAALNAAPVSALTMCGVLDGPGCVPTTCSTLVPHTCLLDEDFPLGGAHSMTKLTASR
jgi:hypothetical protein